ncbi:aminotransferase class III-fold pyridoxal phosphate-dependent enzyme [Roseomonas terrae]|jgi:glutamate-1-semialdehyde 2,1-aminomutase|uniref:Aminotransferase class III-fold pyridoxal phosphate-dependent enzyme n=1 Tax=Neoroseomonas terrae TaxID=424799 RepID=A0ABS5EIN7_9PROT|nr:aminotransferase class III-fold pyridoxal phosphate-dependent enzyme [Neoroseomonas terrae]MBR0650866.1 aminotransferase class III-fold pyridoxal phosphate-dependent enzyme [Neoroseomonas terrae]
MDTNAPTNSPIIAAFAARTPGSAAAYAEARTHFPGGVTHDTRFVRPHPIAVARAAGPRKWDVDGHEYVDYAGGHGALILGHAHPQVMAAVAEQLANGTHYGANHLLENRWAALIKELMPNAEMIRFTNSGTEATLMALRVARAATGRPKLLRLRGHFHGWHDHMAFGVTNHFDGTPTPGILENLAGNVLLVDPNDEAGLAAVMAAHGSEIAAAILEPTGSTFGQVPLRDSFVHALRAETAKHGIVLVFDEVVTGFRVAKGGAQEALGITPDLTTLAKILAGGLPGGAVVGRRDLLELLDPERAAARGVEKIPHQGTYNANPVSAVAGIVTLEILRDADAIARSHAYAADLRAAMNQALVEMGVPWAVYGTYGGVHIFTNWKRLPISPTGFDPLGLGYADLKVPRGMQTVTKLLLALRTHGVDFSPWPGGPVSAAHGPAELSDTVAAFRAAVSDLRAEGEIG